jgi:hypothetical protein
VTWVEHDGARYLVSMPRGEPGWVRNMRAAGGRVVLRHGRRRTEVRLEELPVNRRAPVLRAWYAMAAWSPVPRRYFGLPRRAAVEEFERVAAEHLVFRVVPALDAGKPVTRDVVRRWHLRWRYYGRMKGGVGYVRVVPTTGEILPRP